AGLGAPVFAGFGRGQAEEGKAHFGLVIKVVKKVHADRDATASGRAGERAVALLYLEATVAYAPFLIGIGIKVSYLLHIPIDDVAQLIVLNLKVLSSLGDRPIFDGVG